MKVLLLSFLLLFFTNYISAQTSTTPEVVDLTAWTTILRLDQNQSQQIDKIEYQRTLQLQELATIKNRNLALYNNKLQAINANTLAKLRNLLRPEQLNIYQQEIEKREKEKIAQAKKMRANGATKSEIDNYLNNQ